MQQNHHRIEAVDRALVLLTLLRERGEVSVTAAARELGVAPSTAHRLLTTLSHRAFAVQGAKRLYHPGPALLGPDRHHAAPPLPELVRPHLEALFARTGETVHVMALDGADIEFLDGVEGVQALRVGLRTGTRMPAYCTSGGKAMLAELEPTAVDALHPRGLTPWPGEPIADLPGLHRELELVRTRHFGLNHDESEPGVTAIGASLGRIGGRPAALTIAVPSSRFATTDAHVLTDELLQACREVRDHLSDGTSSAALPSRPGAG